MTETGRRVALAIVIAAMSMSCADAAPPTLGDRQLSDMDSYGCGYGFWLGTPEQDVAVRIAAADPAAGDLPEQASLPDDAWDATVLVGRDLYANWCDDVLGPDEPEAVVAERWPITDGTVTLLDQPPIDGCPASVRATLDGLVATGPDGTMYELGSHEVTNDTWGCVAG